MNKFCFGKTIKYFWTYSLTFMVLVSYAQAYWNNEVDNELYREKRGRQDEFSNSNTYNDDSRWQEHNKMLGRRVRNREFHTCVSGGEYLKGFTLEGGTKAGNYTQLGDVENINDCASLCCQIPSCKQALFLTQPGSGYQSCFQVTCHKHNMCKAISDRSSEYKPELFRRGYLENHHKRGNFH